MKAIKIGVMPREQFQRRVLLIASGEYKPKKTDPKIWFNSIKSLSQVLSEENMELIKIISENHPDTIVELSELSGRHRSNLSRTLKTMEKYGIVELRRHNNSISPIVKSNNFDIKYSVNCI